MTNQRNSLTGKEVKSGLLAAPRQDLLASLVVFLVALPLCMGIAIASGVPVAAGLITGIVGGLIVGFVAGCPLQVSGPAAGLTVIVYEIVQRFGFEMLGIVVLMAGVIQLLAGLFKLGQWFRAVSPAVIKGMLAGIGVLIFVLSLTGAATFVRLPKLATELEDVPAGSELHVEFQKLDYIDHACLDLLMNWAKQHESTGGRLVIDWESLHARFRAGDGNSNDRSATTKTVGHGVQTVATQSTSTD